MGKYCALIGCPSKQRDKDRRFFRFPKDEIRCKQWVQVSGRPEFSNKTAQQLYLSYHVCDLHFTSDEYLNRHYLHKNAIPTQNLPNRNITKTSTSTQTEDLESALHDAAQVSIDTILVTRQTSCSVPSVISKTLQTNQHLSDNTPRKRKLIKDFKIEGIRRKSFEIQFEEVSTLENSYVSTNLQKLLDAQASTVRSTAETTQRSQAKSQNYDPFQEYANDSTDEDTPDIKEEPGSSGDNETDDGDGPSNTDKVFVRSLSDKGHIEGQSRPKRSRTVIEDDLDDYGEQLYEFGKYVAEQLLCLDVEDARVARMEIVAVLSKLAPKRIREPSTVTSIKNSKIGGTVAQTVSSISQGGKTTQPQFVVVNVAGPSNTPMNITEASVSQQGNIFESSASQIARVKIEPEENQSDVMETAPLSQCTMLNVHQVLSPGAPLGYIAVPVTDPQFDIKQYGRSVGPLVTSSGSSVVTQSSSLVPAKTLVIQAGSSNMDFSVVSVKTEPELESTHLNVFGTEEPTESLVATPKSDNKT